MLPVHGPHFGYPDARQWAPRYQESCLLKYFYPQHPAHLYPQHPAHLYLQHSAHSQIGELSFLNVG